MKVMLFSLFGFPQFSVAVLLVSGKKKAIWIKERDVGVHRVLERLSCWLPVRKTWQKVLQGKNSSMRRYRESPSLSVTYPDAETQTHSLCLSLALFFPPLLSTNNGQMHQVLGERLR